MQKQEQETANECKQCKELERVRVAFIAMLAADAEFQAACNALLESAPTHPQAPECHRMR